MEKLLEAIMHRGMLALGVNVVLALVAARAGTVRISGVVAGIIVGSLIWLAGGWRWWLVLVAFFVLGSLLTKFGYRKKAALGLAEEKGGRRGWQNAVANGGVGVLAGLAWLLTDWEPLRAAFAASFATALFDTAGSEIGGLYGRTPISLRSFRKVPPGTEGAVSAEGTAGAFVFALLVALAALAAGQIPISFLLSVVLGSVIGGLYESFAAGRLPLGHQALNFTNTLFGALAALALAWVTTRP
ncbi:MAG TPA: DUF92 domain-containing protein [Candidatus Eisenbacteria bacterium]